MITECPSPSNVALIILRNSVSSSMTKKNSNLFRRSSQNSPKHYFQLSCILVTRSRRDRIFDRDLKKTSFKPRNSHEQIVDLAPIHKRTSTSPTAITDALAPSKSIKDISPNTASIPSRAISVFCPATS